MDDGPGIDDLCRMAVSDSSQSRCFAESQLFRLSMPELHNAMKCTQQPQTAFVLAMVMKKWVINNWATLDEAAMLHWRDFLLDMVAQFASTFAFRETGMLLCVFVKRALTETATFDSISQLIISRFVFESPPSFETLPEDVGDCVVKPTHLVGLSLLAELIEEVRTVDTKRNLSWHRRTLIKFREECLTCVFNCSVYFLKLLFQRGCLSSDEDGAALLEAASRLALECLSYDFAGLLADDVGDVPTCVHAPSNWRATLVHGGGAILLVSALIRSCNSPTTAAQLFRCLRQVVSARRGLFSNDVDRMQWLEQILTWLQTALPVRMTSCTQRCASCLVASSPTIS